MNTEQRNFIIAIKQQYKKVKALTQAVSTTLGNNLKIDFKLFPEVVD